jgi:hypothetical protein
MLRPASWSKRVSDLLKGAKYPYQYLLLIASCIASDVADKARPQGRFWLEDIFLICDKLLAELPTAFFDLRDNHDKIAQPILRLAKHGFWNSYTEGNQPIPFDK